MTDTREAALRQARDFIETVHDGEYGYSECTRDEMVERLDAALSAAKEALAIVPQEPTHQQLMAFYGVDSLDALVDVQARSIDRLQERLSAAEGNPFKHRPVRKA